MTRIVYKIIGNKAEMRSFDSDGGLKGELEIIPPCDGYIVIGDETLRLSAGRVKFDFERLAQGEHTPILYRDSAVTLEPIKREKSSLSFPGTPDFTIRNLLLRAESLEEETKRLSERLDELGGLVKRDVIF